MHPPLEVLIAEDHDQVRMLLSLALRVGGFSVRVACSGEEAVDLYRRHRPHVVLLDVQMPGLDGPQTLAALRQIDPHVRAVFMSGNTGDYTVADLLDLGAACVISKPFRLDDLTQTLRGVAGRGLSAGWASACRQ